MSTKRHETACVYCGQVRHRTCPQCARTQLLTGPDGGLVDHRSKERHDCSVDKIDEAARAAAHRREFGDGPGNAGSALTPDPSPTPTGSLEDVLFATFRSKMGLLLDEPALAEKMRTIASDVAQKASRVSIEIRMPNGETKDVGRQHKAFANLLKMCTVRANVFLVGPAGSGKTRAAGEAAKALDLSFHPKSVGPATTAYELLGYQDASGEYVSAIAWKPFTTGGLLLLDEIDSANAACLTTLNTMIGNDYCSFPHQVAKKHQDFICIASGNTYGRGADHQYVGRTRLDAASLNRFAILHWDYDETLESDLARAKADAASNPTIVEWCAYVHRVRRGVEKSGAPLVAGTRDILDGADLIIAGFSIQETAEFRFWNAVDSEQRTKVEAEMPVANGAR